MNNPFNLIQMFMGASNPKNLMMNMLQSQSQNPMARNLLESASKNDVRSIEQIGRNYFKTQGRDFDKEFADFKSNFKF